MNDGGVSRDATTRRDPAGFGIPLRKKSLGMDAAGLAALRREAERLRVQLAAVELALDVLDAEGVVRARRLARAVAVAARLQERRARDRRVRVMRSHGLGYKRVAAALGISRDAARDLVRRVEGRS